MFKVGAETYSARVTDGPIIFEGAKCVGVCDEAGREILISPTVAPDRRLATLLTELASALMFEIGEPTGRKAICKFVAVVAENMIRDLAACGGEEALRRLMPGERLGRRTGRIGLLRPRYCRCGGMIPAGEILCSPDVEKPDQVKLQMFCEHCRITLSWNELATFGGLPGGVVVGEPKIEEGRTIPECQIAPQRLPQIFAP